MTLKDWKKTGKNVWKNVKNNLTFTEEMYATIKIDNVKVPISWLGTKSRKEYKVSIGNKSGNIENRAEYFKTKTQALTFAKCYMNTENVKLCEKKRVNSNE